MYPKDAQLYHKDMCSARFIAVLVIIARTRKQPRCPSTKEWIKKIRYIYMMEYYSAVKKNDILKLAGKWMNLEKTILNDVTQVSCL